MAAAVSLRSAPADNLTPTPNAIFAESATALANGVAIGSGQNNIVKPGAAFAFIGGGLNNQVTSEWSVIGGGNGNAINLEPTGAPTMASTIGGGLMNSTMGSYATVSGGFGNTASGMYSTVGGGSNNIASGFAATVAGGDPNHATGPYSFIGGGDNNTASSAYSSIVGGSFNLADGNNSTVGGGAQNTASYVTATVGGVPTISPPECLRPCPVASIMRHQAVSVSPPGPVPRLYMTILLSGRMAGVLASPQRSRNNLKSRRPMESKWMLAAVPALIQLRFLSIPSPPMGSGFTWFKQTAPMLAWSSIASQRRAHMSAAAI